MLVGLLAAPFIIRQNAWYEWSNALWLLQLQTAHVHAFGAPSYFIDAAGMLFYPQQLFYAGPLFAVLAYPAVAIGSWPVFAIMTAAAFCGMSAGVSWTARNLGASPDLAVLPGILFAVTPYTVSNLYGRGDWAELVAISALAVAIGAGTSLVLGRTRSVLGVMTTLALAVAVVAGTHNITLLFGGIFALTLALAVLPIRRGSALKRYGLTVAAAAIGVALCGAFIIPDAWLSNQTLIAQVSGSLISQAHGYDRFTILFDPLAGQPPEAHGTFIQTQTLVAGAVWCVIALGIAMWQRWLDRRSAIAIGLMALTAVATVLLIVHPEWWLHFPQQLQAIQFPFRLVSYLALATVLLVASLLACPAVARSRVLRSLLGIAVALQVALGAYLAVSAEPRGAAPAPTASTVRAGVTPAAYQSVQQSGYRIISGRAVTAPTGTASAERLGDDSPNEVHLYGSEPVGTLVNTNLVASPLIHVSGGARLVATSKVGFAVLRVVHTPWQATVTPQCSACLSPGGGNPRPVVLGRWASIIGAVALLGLLVGSGRDLWRDGANARPTGSAATPREAQSSGTRA